MKRQLTGDREQPDFDEFYRSAYARLVGQLFSVTGSVEQAEDVVQEAFIRALSRWTRIQAYDVPELWVRRVAINLAVSELRRLGRQATALLRLGAQRPSATLSPETAHLAEMLRRVPANQRAVLLLHDALDLPLEQVAAQLDLRVSTVRGRLDRARANLARHIATDTDAEGPVSRHV